jgi:hypothetical protein
VVILFKERTKRRCQRNLYRRLLTSTNLQSYLRQETSLFVKQNTVAHADQNPLIFGNFTDRFIIEDLNKIFEEKDALARASDINFNSITIYDTSTGYIQNLPGWKAGHYLPAKRDQYAERFVKNLAGDLISEQISQLALILKDVLKYYRKDIKPSVGEGYGSIQTPDFIWSIDILPSEEDLRE